MGAVFLKILNMSLTAGFLVLAVLLVRLVFRKKAPKALFPVLWALVAVRLVCPVIFESSFSLIRNPEPVEKMLSSDSVQQAEPPVYPESNEPEAVKKFAEEYENYINSLDNPPEEVVVSIVSGPIDTENPEEADYIIQEIDPEKNTLSEWIMNELEAHGSYTELTEDGVTSTYTLVHCTMLKNHRPSAYEILSYIWLAGVAGMILYMLFSYLQVYRKVKESAPEEKNIRICDGIDSPFILGLVRPKIYLPSDISATDKKFVLAHEKAHLKRFDHIWKPLGFLLLSVYWFHPLLWVAYVVLCKDIEYACDEKVIKELGVDQKKDYSTALINCSVSRKMISACPLAFGETGVKGRVKSVLHYKKPAFWVLVISILVCVTMTVCFLTNPKESTDEASTNVTDVAEPTEAPDTTDAPAQEKPKDASAVTDSLLEEIETTNISIAIGDEYAAYLDEDGKLHVLYDTSLVWDYDTAGATRGIDTSKTYKALGTDRRCLVVIDEEGRPFASYHMNAEELAEYERKAAEEAMAAGGTYGLGGPQSWIAKDFEAMSGVTQMFSTYPYSEYTAVYEDGTVFHHGIRDDFTDIVQIAKDGNGVMVGLQSDGTFVVPELSDALRKQKLDAWPDRLKQIAAGNTFFVGLKHDGTVISDGVEQEYMINTIEQWCGIVKIAVANETVVGLKGDGTVVAVCPGRSDKGQCAVDDWTDVIAVNTNGSVTVGITKDGKVLIVGDIPELVKMLPPRYSYGEVRTVLLEYLNHQAWLYPSAYPQESYTCEYELYCSAKENNAKRLYIKTVINETEYWFLFEPEYYYVPESPIRILLQRTEYMRENIESGSIVSMGTDDIYVPAVTKPSYGKAVDEFSESNVSGIYASLKQNGYRDNLKLEVIISEHDMDKNLYPYVYLIINDTEVYETVFGNHQGDFLPLNQMFYYANYSLDDTVEYGDGWPMVFDGHSIKPLSSVDKEQFERVKACAVFHKVLIEADTETVLIDGEFIEVSSTNVAINEETGVGIAFLPQWIMASSVHYNIYRTEDGGTSWRLISEDVTATEGNIARILIPTKDTIVCYFEISGTTSQSSCIVSKDGGVTWNYATYASKPNTFLSNPQKGSSVIFGAYEQDGDESNGKEPLEWLVLDRDGDRALLLSKYGIEAMQWEKDKELEVWEVDDLYWMMNRTIYEYAFSAKERAALIQVAPIENEAIHFTNDRLLYKGYTFLLETDTVLEGKAQDETPFFQTEESRITIPTACAAQKGAWFDTDGAFTGVTAPWLLTVTGTTDGDFSEVEFARVMEDGSISFAEEEIKEAYVLIRPAVWVDVTKLPQQ